MSPQFTGPYTAAEDIGKGRYRLKDNKGKLLKTAIDCHRLKIWHDPDGGRLRDKSKVTKLMLFG